MKKLLILPSAVLLLSSCAPTSQDAEYIVSHDWTPHTPLAIKAHYHYKNPDTYCYRTLADSECFPSFESKNSSRLILEERSNGFGEKETHPEKSTKESIPPEFPKQLI